MPPEHDPNDRPSNEPPGEAANTTPAKLEFVWKVVGRYDFYIGGTNTKAAMLIAFNTFVPGGIVLRWADIRAAFGPDDRALPVIAGAALLVAVSAAALSLRQTFLAIAPYRESPKSAIDGHGLVFFDDVAGFGGPKAYSEYVYAATPEELLKDVWAQAHALASGLRSKYDRLGRAVCWVTWAQLPALAVVLICMVITLVQATLMPG